jgi:hypothetical protein
VLAKWRRYSRHNRKNLARRLAAYRDTRDR